MTGRSDRRVIPGALCAMFVTLLTGCSETGPQAPASKDSSMTVQASHQHVHDIFEAIKSVVGEGGWTSGTESEWNDCSSNGGSGAQFMLTAVRKQQLAGTPDEVTKQVADRLESKLSMRGIRVQHDRTFSPPRTVIGYPNGYNMGTASDGYELQFHTDPEFVGIIIYGHCVPGEVPALGTPMNPRPTDLP